MTNRYLGREIQNNQITIFPIVALHLLPSASLIPYLVVLIIVVVVVVAVSQCNGCLESHCFVCKHYCYCLPLSARFCIDCNNSKNNNLESASGSTGGLVV